MIQKNLIVVTKQDKMYKTIINKKEVTGSYSYLMSLIPEGMLEHKIERI